MKDFLIEPYAMWLARFKSFYKAYKYNDDKIEKKDLEKFQLFLLESGQFNANFDLEELERLKYPRSPFALMFDHGYLRATNTWAMRMIVSLHVKKMGKRLHKGVTSILLDSENFWYELKRYTKCIVDDNYNEVSSEYANNNGKLINNWWVEVVPDKDCKDFSELLKRNRDRIVDKICKDCNVSENNKKEIATRIVCYIKKKFEDIEVLVVRENKHPIELVNSLGYRIDPIKAIKKVLSKYDNLFIQKDVTDGFFRDFKELFFTAKYLQNEQFKKESDLVQKCFKNVLSALEVNQLEDISGATQVSIDKLNSKALQDGFELYRKFLVHYITDYLNTNPNQNSAIRLVADPEIEQCIDIFLSASEQKDMATAVRAVQTVAEVMLLDLDLRKQSINTNNNQTLGNSHESYIVSYGMRAFVRVFQILDCQYEKHSDLNIFVTSQSYYEWIESVEEMVDKKTHVSLIQQSSDVDHSADIIFIELHPNNIMASKQFEFDVSNLLAKMQNTEWSEKKRTLVIDVTLNFERDSEIKSLLEASKELVNNGNLNIILIQSLTKFAQIGLDKRSAGLITIINNNSDIWQTINTKLKEYSEKERVDKSTIKYFEYFSQIPNLKEKYIKLVNDNVNYVYEQFLQKMSYFGIREYGIHVTTSSDPKPCYVGLNTNGFVSFEIDTDTISSLVVDFQKHFFFPLCKVLKLPISERFSIGFPLTSVNPVYGSLRLTIGLEDKKKQLDQYADVLAYSSFVVSQFYDRKMFFYKDKAKHGDEPTFIESRIAYFKEKVEQFAMMLSTDTQIEKQYKFDMPPPDKNEYHILMRGQQLSLLTKSKLPASGEVSEEVINLNNKLLLEKQMILGSFSNITRPGHYAIPSIQIDDIRKPIKRFQKVLYGPFEIGPDNKIFITIDGHIIKFIINDKEFDPDNVFIKQGNIIASFTDAPIEDRLFLIRESHYMTYNKIALSYKNEPEDTQLEEHNIYLYYKYTEESGSSTRLFYKVLDSEGRPKTYNFLPNDLPADTIRKIQEALRSSSKTTQLSTEDQNILKDFFRNKEYKFEENAILHECFSHKVPLPIEIAQKEFFFEEGKLYIERDLLCTQSAGVKVYSRYINSKTTSFEIDFWQEKDPNFSRFLRLITAIYVKEQSTCYAFKARDSRYTHFIFNIDQETGKKLFRGAINKVIEKIDRLKECLEQFQKELYLNNGESYEFKGRGTKYLPSWPSGYNARDTESTYQVLIEKAMHILLKNHEVIHECQDCTMYKKFLPGYEEKNHYGIYDQFLVYYSSSNLIELKKLIQEQGGDIRFTHRYPELQNRTILSLLVEKLGKDIIPQILKCLEEYNDNMHALVMNGMTEIILYLIDEGVKFDEEDDDHHTSLEYAIKHHRDEIAKKLIDLGANCKTRISTKCIDSKETGIKFLSIKSSALHVAAQYANYNIFAYILQEYPYINVNEEDHDSLSPIHHALRTMEHPSCGEYYYSDVSEVKDKKEKTNVIIENSKRIVELLVKHGTNGRFGYYNSKTIYPLLWIFKNLGHEIFADVALRTESFESKYEVLKVYPIHLATECAHQSEKCMAAFKYIVSKGTNLGSEKDMGEKFPLAIAITKKNFEAVKILVEAGADVNYKTGRFPDYIRDTSLEILQYLVAKGMALDFEVLSNHCNVDMGKKAFLSDCDRMFKAVKNNAITEVIALHEKKIPLTLVYREEKDDLFKPYIDTHLKKIVVENNNPHLVKYFLEYGDLKKQELLPIRVATLAANDLYKLLYESVKGDFKAFQDIIKNNKLDFETKFEVRGKYEVHLILDIAILEQKIQHVEYILYNNLIDANYVDHLKRTPLIYAIQSKNIEIVLLLLQYGAILFPEGADSPFNEITKEQSEILELLLLRSIDLDKKKINDTDVIAHLIQQKDAKLLEVLLQYIPDIEINNYCMDIYHKDTVDGMPNTEKVSCTPLQYAAYYGLTDIGVFLLKDSRIKKDARSGAFWDKNKSYPTALELAVMQGKYDFSKMLVRSGAQIRGNACILIFYALKYQDLSFVDDVIKITRDHSQELFKHFLKWDLSKSFSNQDYVSILKLINTKEVKSKLNKRMFKDFETLLVKRIDLAKVIETKDEKCLILLMGNFDKLENNRLLFHNPCILSNYRILKIALEEVHKITDLKAILNSLDGDRASPLHVAVRSKNSQSLGLLIEYGMKHDFRDSTGLTALEFAKQTKANLAVQILSLYQSKSTDIPVISDYYNYHRCTKFQSPKKWTEKITSLAFAKDEYRKAYAESKLQYSRNKENTKKPPDFVR